MSTVIEHVRHRVLETGAGIVWTACGRRFLPSEPSPATRHHQPARHRCRECYP